MELSKEQIAYLKSLDSKKKKRKFLLDCLIENVELFNEFKELLTNQFQFDGKWCKVQKPIGESDKLATPKEIKSKLIEEARAKGYKQGVKVVSVLDFNKYSLGSRGFKYNKSEGLRLGGVLIFSTKNNEWAEIIDSPSEKSNHSPEEIELVKHNINQREVTEQGSELLKFDILTRKHQLPFLTEFQKEGIVKWMHDWEQLTNTSIPIRFLEDCRSIIDRDNLMIDNENHLCWVFNRLVLLGENPNLDYMVKFREIANKYNEIAK